MNYTTDEKKKAKKFTLAFMLEVIFAGIYIGLFILATVDLLGWLNFISSENWTKILTMVFGSVGLVILGDLRKMEKDVEPKVNDIQINQRIIVDTEKDIKKDITEICKSVDKKCNITYFANKTQFYLTLSDLIMKLPKGANVDVTSFEKNYNLSYAVGENVHIEAFMKTWVEMVRNNEFIVRQLVHVTSYQDYIELKDRVKQFENNYNFTIGAIVGLPIAPFVDYMILGQEYIFLGFSNDLSSPNNLSFGCMIKSKEMALNFQNHFNIYWSNQFSYIVKDKDEIKNNNLNIIGKSVYDVDHNEDRRFYNQLVLELYHIGKCNNDINKLIKNLNRFYGNVCYEILKDQVENTLKNCIKSISDAMNEYVVFTKNDAVQIMSRMIFNSKYEIRAVSVDMQNNDFWQVEDGEQFFQANVEAISNRNVEIQRVFVYEKSEKNNMLKIMKEQLEAGINVFHIEYRKGVINDIEDFFIIDNEALLVFSDDDVKVSICQKHIEAYNKKYVDIKIRGTEFKILNKGE